MNTETVIPKERVNEAESGAAVRSSDWLGRVIVFAIYSILYEAIIWGIFGWAVFVKDRSGWWVLVAIICSGSQLKPKHFGIPEAKRPNDGTQRPGSPDGSLATETRKPGSLK